MRYISTRGDAPILGFEDVLLKGLASDGGLYWPETFPQLTEDQLRSFVDQPYVQVAAEVMYPFVADCYDRSEWDGLVKDAYKHFDHAEVAPLRQIGAGEWLLELFHGPTLAFKDVAMQLLGPLFDRALERRDRHVTVIGATSGDTGSAAIEALRGRERVSVVIMHPHNRTSDVQRRQMTTILDSNVHNIALEGTFDDCQAAVKAMFAHESFADKVSMTGVNSINWARVMAQTVYYVTAAVALGAPDRAVSFTVPTGNFGDILAGYVAKRMGVPIDRLVIATNENDILARALETGRYEKAGVVATDSPSMDIEISSNFERLLFETGGRDAGAITRAMSSLGQSGSFTIEEKALTAMRADFDAARADQKAMSAAIKQVAGSSATLIDPHTAVGIAAGRSLPHKNGVPMVYLSTAHPAKFPAAVNSATGQTPDLPPHMADLFEREERFTVLANDLDVLENFILKSVGVDG